MGKSSDELRQEIDMHRADAERKINDLQGQIQGTADDLKSQAQGTVEDLRHQVQDTATDVREQVQGTMEDTIQTVKENVDFEQFVQERPLVSLGAALIGGFVLGGILDGSSGGGGGSSHASPASGSGAYSGSSSTSHSGLSDSIRNMYKSSGLEDTVNNAAAAMMGSVTEQLKQTMDRNMPGFSDKMDSAKRTEGSVMDKSREVQP
jgi:ElaB/YqjD/DUF883 family membrane-anchored ribosome-binding protein